LNNAIKESVGVVGVLEILYQSDRILNSKGKKDEKTFDLKEALDTAPKHLVS
jgi:hypothetical protein